MYTAILPGRLGKVMCGPCESLGLLRKLTLSLDGPHGDDWSSAAVSCRGCYWIGRSVHSLV